MTVKELIEKLQLYPQELEVRLMDGEWGAVEVVDVSYGSKHWGFGKFVLLDQ